MTDGIKNSLGDKALSPHNVSKHDKLSRPNIGRSSLNSDGDYGEGLPLIDKFFADRNKTFWTFQLLGWSGYGLVRSFQWMVSEYRVYEFAGIVLFTMLVGFVLSSILRYVYRAVRDLNIGLVILIAIAASSIAGAGFSALELAVQPYLLASTPFVGLQRLGNTMFEATALFAWSSIYFGYHYYTGFLEQQERALKATAMAHQAQLKMLRYQLNPHFLFNTLNAISTLVLEKSGDDANKMLTKLSSFLRYTLVNQPTQRISLEQELQATSLYLDIEAVRFGDRLKIVLDIDDDTKSALVPSLILQPLIENAIKYAIAPEIDGGTIKICAKRDGRRLMLMLEDTGPGISDLNNIVSQSGSGVGIANTKDRLIQIYGETHDLTLKNMEPSGLSITIAIPLEHSSRTKL
jgi:signal transduction histidine kinase